MKRILIQKLVQWQKDPNRKPLLMKGVRQVGKTYILKEFGQRHFPKYHYFNFEKEPGLSKIFEKDLDPHRILQELSFVRNLPIDVGQDLVIFDEIQEAPKALTSLKYFQEECSSLHICGAGSLLGLHLNGESFPVGKVSFEILRPMTFEEFLMASNDKALSFLQQFTVQDSISEVMHEHLWEQFKHYLIVGGLPEIVDTYCTYKEDLFRAFSLVRQKQDDLLNAYFSDIAKHSGKENAMHIERIFRAVPAQLSHAIDTSTRRFKFRGVVPGVSHYDRLAGAIDWLEKAGLVIKVPIVNTAYFPLQGHVQDNMFKLLLFDIGILGSMASIPPKMILDSNYGSYKGYIAENFVAQELLGHLKDQTLYNWQEKRSEIEFLIAIEGKVVPIEVKSGQITKSKSLTIFSEKYHPPSQIILSGKPLSIKNVHYNYPLYLAGKIPMHLNS